MKVRWSERADGDLANLVRYVALDNVAAALRLHERILEAAEKLNVMPERGRIGAVEGTRELVLVGTPYMLVYEVSDQMVRITRVRHGSQEWPPQK